MSHLKQEKNLCFREYERAYGCIGKVVKNCSLTEKEAILEHMREQLMFLCNVTPQQ